MSSLNTAISQPDWNRQARYCAGRRLRSGPTWCAATYGGIVSRWAAVQQEMGRLVQVIAGVS